MNRATDSSKTHVETIDYGRPEVKRVLQKNYFIGFAVSVVLHMCVIGLYYLIEYVNAEENIPTVTVRIMKYSDLGPPPSITSANVPPPISVAGPVAKPTVGVPVPVPDAEVSPEQTIATQQEMSSVPTPALEQFGEGSGVEIAQDIVIDSNEPGIDEFIPVEKEPKVVTRVVPAYPEMALRAGLEGTVWVKMLVDKDGKVKKAVVVRSTTEIFNDAAVEAAMQFVFTPAVMNNGPVKVWVAMPFRFMLKTQSPS
jgi:protein TonB